MKLIIIKLLVTISVVCLVKGYYYEDFDEDEDVKSLVKRQANYYYNDNLDTTTVTTKRIIKKCPTNAAGKRLRCKKKKRKTTTPPPNAVPASWIRIGNIMPIMAFVGDMFNSNTTKSPVTTAKIANLTTITTSTKPSANSTGTETKTMVSSLQNIGLPLAPIAGLFLPTKNPSNPSTEIVPASDASTMNKISPATVLGAGNMIIMQTTMKPASVLTTISSSQSGVDMSFNPRIKSFDSPLVSSLTSIVNKTVINDSNVMGAVAPLATLLTADRANVTKFFNTTSNLTASIATTASPTFTSSSITTNKSPLLGNLLNSSATSIPIINTSTTSKPTTPSNFFLSSSPATALANNSVYPNGFLSTTTAAVIGKITNGLIKMLPVPPIASAQTNLFLESTTIIPTQISNATVKIVGINASTVVPPPSTVLANTSESSNGILSSSNASSLISNGTMKILPVAVNTPFVQSLSTTSTSTTTKSSLTIASKSTILTSNITTVSTKSTTFSGISSVNVTSATVKSRKTTKKNKKKKKKNTKKGQKLNKKKNRSKKTTKKISTTKKI